MSRTMYRIFHVPCFLFVTVVSLFARTLISLHDFWIMHKDTINWYSARIIREIRFAIPKIATAIKVLAVAGPVLVAFLLVMIRLSY